MIQTTANTIYRLTDFKPDPALLRLVPEQVARECLAVPLRTENGTLIVASANPTDAKMLRRLSSASRRPVRVLTTIYPDIREALDIAYGKALPERGEPVEAEICLRLGYLQPDHLPLIQEKASNTGLSFLDACERLDLMSFADLVEARAIFHYLPYLREKTTENLSDLSELVPWELAQAYRVLPLCWTGNHLLIGSAAMIPLVRLKEIEHRTGLAVQYVLLARDHWDKLYRRFYLRGGIDEDPDQEISRALARSNVISAEDLQNALSIQAQSGRPLGEVILELGLVDRRDYFQARAKVYKVAYHDLSRFPPVESAALEDVRRKIPDAIAQALQILPLQAWPEHCIVGMVKPTIKQIRLLEHLAERPVEARLVDGQILHEYYQAERLPEKAPETLGLPSADEFAVRLGMVTPLLMERVQQQTPFIADSSDILVRAGLIDDVDLAELYGLHSDMPFVRLERAQFNESQLREIPRDLMILHTCIPLCSTKQELWVAVVNPLNGCALQAVEKATGKRVWPVIAPGTIILSILERTTGLGLLPTHQEIIRILESLVNSGHLTQLEASHALKAHRSEQIPLDVAIARESTYLSEELTVAIARILNIPAVSLKLNERETTFISPMGEQVTRVVSTDPVDGATARLIDLKTAQKWCALPVDQNQSQVEVAFADPDFQPALAELQTIIGRPVVPFLSPRDQLQGAIQRTLGRRNLGTYLLLEGLITGEQLNLALDLALRTGVRIGRALVSRRSITSHQLYQFIARQSGLPFLDLGKADVDENIARRIPADIARKHGILPIREDGGAIQVATTDPLDESALALAGTILQQPVRPVVVTDIDLDTALERLYSSNYLAKSVSELLERAPEDSAFRVLSRGQIGFLILFLLISAVWLFFGGTSYFIFINVLATSFYLAFSAYKLYLIYGALNKDLEVPVTQEEMDNLDESQLPIYTILIPVYREADMLPELLDAVERLDYPMTKMDIKILMEEDDQETIQAFHDWNPPPHFQGIVVPPGQPKTKPKACNYGLIHARGEYVVIFDAEDLPDPDQLKKAAIAFTKVDQDVVCLQSRLNYYNRDQNLLTRWFTIEYSMWFDLFLPGLVASGAPVPLGGTSNHFRRDALVEIGAWDPYNVTEDADLGIRLYKRGYKTFIIQSTTYEEANSKLDNWIRQRSRWIKGYIQTWLVHMRNPARLIKEIGWKAFMGFQFVVGGTFFSALLNPVYWVFTTIWYLYHWRFIQEIFPSVIFYLGAVCLFFGNFAFTYVNVAGALRRNYYGMVKYALVSPFYWALASIAAWRGFLQLFRNPYYWEKTIHGLSNKPSSPDGPGNPAGPASSGQA
jgi:cellulose synthase/poly-beta-1,6-N-acetylglucosamine synthase-like glycosyltransferase